MKTYRVVVPTLDRPQNMKRILALFPNATITVNQSNVGMFSSVVPPKQLVPHPDMRLIETRNWILDTFDEECIIQFNDDVDKLVSLAARSRTFRDARLICGVIENAIAVTHDIGLGVFCWSLTGNSALLHPDIKPFRPSAPVSAHAFGILGPARNRRFDTAFRGCGDFDFTLESLLHDRAIFCDCRWHFSCGGMSRGAGGQTGELRPQEFDGGQKALRDKWHKYVGRSKTKRVSKRETWRDFCVNVQRKSPLAIS